MGVGIQQLFENIGLTVTLIVKLTSKGSQTKVPAARCNRRVLRFQIEFSILRLVIDRRIDTLRGRAAGAFLWSVREILFNDIINPRLIFDDLREDKYISRHDEIPTALVNLHAVAVVFSLEWK